MNIVLTLFKKSDGEKPNITKKYSFDNDKQVADIICNFYKNHYRKRKY